jgi:antitoxin YefM
VGGDFVGPQPGTAAYEKAVELLGELERLLAPHGRRDDHARLVAEVRYVTAAGATAQAARRALARRIESGCGRDTGARIVEALGSLRCCGMGDFGRFERTRRDRSSRSAVHAEYTDSGLQMAEIVTRILVMSETLPLSSVKAHLSELVDRVEDQHDRVVVTRNGKPAAVLVSPEDLESLEETLAILSDPVAMEQIRESERSLAAGEPTTSLAEIQAQLEARRRDATT